MKTVLFWVATASLVLASISVVGCNKGEGPVTKEDVNKVNSGLPPDDGKGPGSVPPIHPGGPVGPGTGKKKA